MVKDPGPKPEWGGGIGSICGLTLAYMLELIVWYVRKKLI